MRSGCEAGGGRTEKGCLGRPFEEETGCRPHTCVSPQRLLQDIQDHAQDRATASRLSQELQATLQVGTDPSAWPSITPHRHVP